MGFVFLECLNVKPYYSCRVCRVELIDLEAFASLTFVREWCHPAAVLCRKMVNVLLDPEKDVQLLSGRYTLASLFCCNCCHPIGWRYERAQDEGQSHKNGMYCVGFCKTTLIHNE